MTNEELQLEIERLKAKLAKRPSILTRFAKSVYDNGLFKELKEANGDSGVIAWIMLVIMGHIAVAILCVVLFLIYQAIINIPIVSSIVLIDLVLCTLFYLFMRSVNNGD